MWIIDKFQWDLCYIMGSMLSVGMLVSLMLGIADVSSIYIAILDEDVQCLQNNLNSSIISLCISIWIGLRQNHPYN